MSRFLLAAIPAATALCLAVPALAQQSPDFGSDTSVWANDGECDDPRFEGEGMASATVDEDRMADATDCRAAFEEGTVRLVGRGEAPRPRPAQGEAEGEAEGEDSAEGAAPRGERAPAEPRVPRQPRPAPAGAVEFGDDSGDYPQDQECDDPRFTGDGVASSLAWQNAGRDATDCRALVEDGQARVWDWAEARAATDCGAIDWGDDSSEFASDGQCDDPRFEGIGAAFVMTEDQVGIDASDCSRLCSLGVIALRDY